MSQKEPNLNFLVLSVRELSNINQLAFLNHVVMSFVWAVLRNTVLVKKINVKFVLSPVTRKMCFRLKKARLDLPVTMKLKQWSQSLSSNTDYFIQYNLNLSEQENSFPSLHSAYLVWFSWDIAALGISYPPIDLPSFSAPFLDPSILLIFLVHFSRI